MTAIALDISASSCSGHSESEIGRLGNPQRVNVTGRWYQLFYLDPAYWGSEGDYGKALFVRDDFARLADRLDGLRGRFLMSINDAPEVRETLARFEIEEVVASYSVGRRSGASDRAPELLVSRL